MDIISYGMADEALEKAKKVDETIEGQVKPDIEDLKNKLNALDASSAQEAIAKAEQASINALNAINTADTALSTALDAQLKATTAKSTADGLASQVQSVVGKADTAISKATSAESTANSAKTTATNADAKAAAAQSKADQVELDLQEALSDIQGGSQLALERANEAHLIASNVKAGYDIDVPKLKTDVASAKTAATTAKTTADTALAKATAVESALNSLPTPTEGEITTDQLYNQILITDSKANEAKTKADLAYSTVNGLDGKAQEALDRVVALEGDFASTANNAQTAIDKATTAESTVNTLATDLNAKVNTATSKADQAKVSADLASSKADGFASDIATAQTSASTALNTANQAKQTADSMASDLADAVQDASSALTKATSAETKANTASTRASSAETAAGEAKTIAQGIDAKATQAKADATASVSTANTAKTVAEGIDAKATKAMEDAEEALLIAKEARDTADGVDGKATQAQTDSATALASATSAKATAEGIDSKATQAQADSATALTAASDAYTIANSIETKADQALSDATDAKTSATQAKTDASTAKVTANTASQVASTADDKADEALVKAAQAINQFSSFRVKPPVETETELLKLTGNEIDDLRIVRDVNKFYRFTESGWKPIGIAESDLALIQQLKEDFASAAAPYTSVKTRLDALEGYIREWSATVQSDFDRGTYDGAKYNGGVVLDKKMMESITILNSEIPNYWTVINSTNDSIVPTLSGYQSDAPVSVSVSSTYDTINYFGWKAFNRTAAVASYDCWASATLPAWLVVDLGEGNATSVLSYSLQARTGTTGVLSPRTWVIEGSETGEFNGEQVAIDVRTDEPLFAQNEIRTYTTNNERAFRYYRIYVTASNLGSGTALDLVCIANWKLFTATAQPRIRPRLLGKYGWLLNSYIGTNTYTAIEAQANFKFSSTEREMYLGFRMSEDGENGYILSFKGDVGQDMDGNTYRNVIEIYKVASGLPAKIASLNYVMLDDIDFSFKLRVEGTNIQVWRDTTKLIDITDTSFASGRFALYETIRRVSRQSSSFTFNRGLYGLEVL